MNEPCTLKRDLNAFVENVDSCQLAQSAHIEHGRNRFAISHFFAYLRTVQPNNLFGC